MQIMPVWLFQNIEGSTRLQILCWWEQRRFRYNLLVGIVGGVTWFLVLVAGAAAVKPGVDFEEPIAMIIGPFIYALLANTCYTFGSVIDTVFYCKSPRVGLFKTGLIFSIVLTALPGLWAVIAWLIAVFTGKKMD